MPKETIAGTGSDNGLVNVQWSRAGYVTLGTGTVTGDGELGGAYAELDREGINKVIRVLRRARDQAFGADA